MEQLLLHLIGDYLTQSDWMAINKVKRSLPALIHVTIYSFPFLLLTKSYNALFIIWFTHFLIDRFRLARYVVFIKNFIAPQFPTWNDCKDTGYPNDRPSWLTVWLLIIADNILHLTINYIAL